MDDSPTVTVITHDGIQADSLHPKKWLAAVFAVTLGPFGVHRLYLGTSTKVPIFYTLTLGGGLGILPLIDLIAILTNDRHRFTNNERVIMWLQ